MRVSVRGRSAIVTLHSLADDPEGPLFRTIGRGTGLLTRTPPAQPWMNEVERINQGVKKEISAATIWSVVSIAIIMCFVMPPDGECPVSKNIIFVSDKPIIASIINRVMDHMTS